MVGLIWCKIYEGKYREANEDVKYMCEINASINISKSYKMCLLEVLTQAHFGANEGKVLELAKDALKIYIQTNITFNGPVTATNLQAGNHNIQNLIKLKEEYVNSIKNTNYCKSKTKNISLEN